jgi:hypothetical protein
MQAGGFWAGRPGWVWAIKSFSIAHKNGLLWAIDRRLIAHEMELAARELAGVYV